MNMSDYKSYIDKLCTMSNNYYVYDDYYIKNKYNIDSYNKFRKYFKKHHSNKLIFNSEKSENFFIKVMNIDSFYMAHKYNNYQAQIIVDFFIKRNQCYFNECDELNILNGINNHINNCKCKIKVKSVANLSINALVYILLEQNNDNKKYNLNKNINSNKIEINQSSQNVQIVKLYNNESNKKLIDCIKKIESVKNNLGLHNDNTQYQLTDTKPIIIDNIINDIPQNKQIDLITTGNISNVLLSDNNKNPTNILLLNLEPVNIKKYDEQLISDSINLNETDNEESISKHNIFKKQNIATKSNMSDIYDNNRFNNLTQYAIKNSNKEQFKIDDIKSDSTNNFDLSDKSDTLKDNNSTVLAEYSESNNSDRFGNVIIKDNMIKIEKKQPGDLNNSSDILVSYNENDYKNKKNTTISIINDTELSNRNNTQINNKVNDNIINLNKKIFDDKCYENTLSTSSQINTSQSKENLNKDIHNVKREVIEILNYLDSNFNYITSDDILIDKDKKIQICTFMVEVKYKIFEMFRQLEKTQKINSQHKSIISNNYENIYHYVVQSNKIGSTGEMIEFNKNKQLIQNIIEDIIQI